MAKDPAFLFYPGDWDGGTKLFTRAEKGAYMDLLICQFQSGHMTAHDIAHVLGQADYENMWANKLKSKFKEDADGKFFNERLEIEQLRRKKWCDSRKNNPHGINQYVGHMTAHMGGHMENENRNENKAFKSSYISKRVKKSNMTKVFNNIYKKFKRPTLDQVIEYCREIKSSVDPEMFFHTYESSGWIKANGQKVQNWKSTIRTWEKKQQQTPTQLLKPTGKPQAELVAIQQVAMKLSDEQIKDNMLAQGYTEQRIFEAISKARGKLLQ